MRGTDSVTFFFFFDRDSVSFIYIYIYIVGKTGFTSHTKHTVEVTNTDLQKITCNFEF